MTPAQFLELLISLSVQAAIVVVVTHWLCQLVEAPTAQCKLWSTCHVVLLALIGAGMFFPHFRIAHPWSALEPQTAERLAETEFSLGRLLLIGWAIGASVSLALVAREWVRAWRFLKTCTPADDLLSPAGQSLRIFPESALADGPKMPRLLTSPSIGSPFCCQWHVPHLVLPEFMRHSDPDAVRFVVRHELAHLHSGHPLQLFLQRLVETAFWFHPLVHWASRESSLAREFACDDAAVTNRREVVGYLKVLLEIAERGQTREAEGALLFFGRGASLVAIRGRRLVKLAESGRPLARHHVQRAAQLALVTVAVVAGLLWTPFDVLASSRTNWSPWPTWSAGVLRTFNIPARDFEPYETRSRLHELQEHTALIPATP